MVVLIFSIRDFGEEGINDHRVYENPFPRISAEITQDHPHVLGIENMIDQIKTEHVLTDESGQKRLSWRTDEVPMGALLFIVLEYLHRDIYSNVILTVAFPPYPEISAADIYYMIDFRELLLDGGP